MRNRVFKAMCKVPMNLQLFAEGGDGAGAGEGNGGGSGEGTGGEGDNPPSFDDFLKTGSNQAEFDRRVQKAVNTAVTNAQEKWQALTDDKLSEAEKLAKMTKEEKAQYMQNKKEKELSDREAAVTRSELMAEAKNNLSDEGLPVELPYNRGAWHVGVNYGGRLFGTVNNRNSVGIEMCVQAGYNYEKAFQNTVQVCKQLMKQLGIPADRVVQHYDVCAKNCPSAIRAKGDWNRFKQLIGAKTDTPTVDKYYRTRKSWADSKSQIGAYKSLENAKKEWKQGYTIYDWNGKAVYPVQISKKAVVLTGKFETQLPIIRKGNSGVAVSVLQSVLGVTVDGHFGDDTETSLKVFQKNTGVKVSGTCGIDSWKRVIEHMKANT